MQKMNPAEAIIWIAGILLMTELAMPVLNVKTQLSFSKIHKKFAVIWENWMGIYKKWLHLKIIYTIIISIMLYIGFRGNEIIGIVSCAVVGISAVLNMTLSYNAIDKSE